MRSFALLLLLAGPARAQVQWQTEEDPRPHLKRAVFWLARGGPFEVQLEGVGSPPVRAALDGHTLVYGDAPRAVRLDPYTGEGVPEFTDGELSLMVMEVQPLALAGIATRFDGAKLVARTFFKIIQADRRAMEPLARLLIERTGFRIEAKGRLLPIDARFSLEEQVPFWSNTPVRQEYRVRLVDNGTPVAILYVNNTDKPGEIRAVVPTAPGPAFDAVWAAFPYRCNHKPSCP